MSDTETAAQDHVAFVETGDWLREGCGMWMSTDFCYVIEYYIWYAW